MRIAIFGTGGVGANFGGFLAASGVDVTFIARGEQLSAMQASGLHITGPKGDFTVNPVHATDDIETLSPVDVIMVCVKAWQLEEAAHAIRKIIRDDTIVLPLQNSIEAPDQLAALLGEAHVLGGVCYTTSFIIAPGRVQANGGEIVLGELKGGTSKRTEELAMVIKGAKGLTCENASDIRMKMWKKFAWISAASATGAVTRTPIGIWRTIPESKALFEKLLSEGFDVAKADGVTLPSSEQDQIIAFMDKTPPHFTTSLQRDLIDGKRSELEYQLGSVIRLGRKHNVPTPLSEAIFAALKPQEMLAQKKIDLPKG